MIDFFGSWPCFFFFGFGVSSDEAVFFFAAFFGVVVGVSDESVSAVFFFRFDFGFADGDGDGVFGLCFAFGLGVGDSPGSAAADFACRNAARFCSSVNCA